MVAQAPHPAQHLVHRDRKPRLPLNQGLSSTCMARRPWAQTTGLMDELGGHRACVYDEPLSDVPPTRLKTPFVNPQVVSFLLQH